MKKQTFRTLPGIRFRRFAHRPYAVFCSFSRPVTIGVMTVAMLAYANSNTAMAQIANKASDPLYELEEVEVSGSRVPLPIEQVARWVTVLDRKAIEAVPVHSVNDLLQYAVGVDVRQRGGLGVQTDISIRGGTFDQIAILLNGINICDPQTGHNAADFPVQLSEIERIEVLQGPAGRVYGTSSLVGAINIVTHIAAHNSGDVQLEGGFTGYADANARININGGRFRNQVSGGYTRNDGYSRSAAGHLNADLQQGKCFYQGTYTDPTVDVRWHAGFSDKDYGANTFYSTASDEQFEHVRKYHVALQATTKGTHFRVRPAVYWNRSEDRFEFFRGHPERSPYNYHCTDVFGLNLNNELHTIAGTTAFGAELRSEGIVSTTLGEPLQKPQDIPSAPVDYTCGLQRTHISFFLEHNYQWRGLSASAGVVAVKNTGNERPFGFYPGVDVGYQFARDWKVFASYNTSLRMPTFTELYYKVGGHQADKKLRPEEMQAFELGLKYATPQVQGTLNVYRNDGRHLIDWIKDVTQGPDAPWVSVNHTSILTHGVEAAVQVRCSAWEGCPSWLPTVNVAYAYIHQDKHTTPNIQSKYALEYLRHKLVGQLDFRLWQKLGIHVACRWHDRVGNYQQRDGSLMAYSPYTLLDARLSWDEPFLQVYAEANNLLNRQYYDHGNIPQPGLWMKFGVRWRFRY